MNYHSSPYREGITRRCPTCGHEPQNGPVQVDVTRNAIRMGDWTLQITPCQTRIAQAIAAAYPRGATYEHIEHVIYGNGAAQSVDPQNTIKTMVCHLRNRLSKAGAPFRIVTYYGTGYGLEVN
jgi:DNA-binding response OmpR family regulator